MTGAGPLALPPSEGTEGMELLPFGAEKALHPPVHTEHGQVHAQQQQDGHDGQDYGDGRLQHSQEAVGQDLYLIVVVVGDHGQGLFQITGLFAYVGHLHKQV